METKTEFNFVDINSLNIVKEKIYTNKYGETIHMVEAKDGDVYFKHEDFHNEFIKFDDLVRLNYPVRLAIILNSEEKEFVSNFLGGTKYEYLIPHILEQKGY